MSRRRRPKKKKREEADLYVELGLDPNAWQIAYTFTKGMLTNARGVVAEVTNLKTGRRLKGSRRGGTKAQCEVIAKDLVRELVQKLS